MAYIFSWYINLYFTIKLYLRMSKTGDACYIVTAAARGHERVVGSRPVMLRDGRTMAVNDQLLYLKAGELALKGALPRFHRKLRMVYDVVGPVLARCLFCAVLADVAYVLLKPAEWICRFILRLELGDRAKKIAVSVYNSE